MRLLKEALGVLGALVVVALIMAFAAPKRAHALVAALVQVTNTPANPVSTLAADAATAFVASGQCSFSSSNHSNTNVCEIQTIYTVPAGQVAVIDSYSGSCQLDLGAAEQAIQFQLNYIGPSGTSAELFIPASPAIPFPVFSQQITSVGQNIRSYASAGNINTTVLAQNVETSPNDICNITLSGHLVTP
jgi:hypothetical protein